MPLFDFQVVAENRTPATFANGITVRPTATLDEVKPNVIVIPSIEEELDSTLRKNQNYIEWIKKSYEHGVHLASLCTGAFVLGETGVLNGRRATTHWFFANEFRKRFPQVDLCDDRLLVDEGDIVTCGGATSFLNLMIYLLEKYFGHDLAIRASKIFLIDMDRPSQRPFMIHTLCQSHGDQEISRIEASIAEHFKEKLAIDDMAKKAGMSVRNFSRRFKAATGEAFSSYVQKMRIENAKRLLESTNLSASEIMYHVGYNDDRSFRRLFKRHTSLSPRHYREKFTLKVTTRRRTRAAPRSTHKHRRKLASTIRSSSRSARRSF